MINCLYIIRASERERLVLDSWLMSLELLIIIIITRNEIANVNRGEARRRDWDTHYIVDEKDDDYDDDDVDDVLAFPFSPGISFIVRSFR